MIGIDGRVEEIFCWGSIRAYAADVADATEELEDRRIESQHHTVIRRHLDMEDAADIEQSRRPFSQPHLPEYGTVNARWHSMSCACNRCLNTDWHVLDPAELGGVFVDPLFAEKCSPGYDRYASTDDPGERFVIG